MILVKLTWSSGSKKFVVMLNVGKEVIEKVCEHVQKVLMKKFVSWNFRAMLRVGEEVVQIVIEYVH